jgi:hypothetical protein
MHCTSDSARSSLKPACTHTAKYLLMKRKDFTKTIEVKQLVNLKNLESSKAGMYMGKTGTRSASVVLHLQLQDA